jgi:hypothetical protein
MFAPERYPSGEQQVDDKNAREGLVTPVTSPDNPGMAPIVRTGGVIDQATMRDLVTACQKQAYDETRDVRDNWTELYLHYRMAETNPEKEGWQSQIYLPELNPAAKKAASILQSILLQSDKYFELESDDPQDRATLKGQEAAIRYHHNQPWRPTEGGQIKHSKGGIMDLFHESFESLAVFGPMIAKCAWRPNTKLSAAFANGGWSDPGRSGGASYQDSGYDLVRKSSSSMYYGLVDPRQFYHDEDQTFFVEERIITAPQLWPMADGGLFDKDKVGEIVNRNYDASLTTEQKQLLESKGLMESQNPFRRRVHLYEYWGDALDRNGKVVERNCRFVLANGDVILNPSNYRNPFWHGQPPYIICNPLKVLFRTIGQSVIEGGLAAQIAINDIARMSLDGLLIRLLKPMWVNWRRVLNKNQLQKLEPLSMIHIDSVEGDGPPMGEIPMGDIPASALGQTEIIRRALQNSTFLGDVNMGTARQGDPTATEVAVKSKETHGMFETIARSIEVGYIEPIVNMTRWLMLQFWDDFSDPALVEMAQKYGLPFAASSRSERVQFLTSNVQVKSRGISGYFERINQRNQLVELLQIYGRTPEFLMRLNKRAFIERVNSTFNFHDPEDLLISLEMDAMLSKLEWEKLMAMMGAGLPQQGGGMPSPEQAQQGIKMMMDAGIDPKSPQGQAVLKQVQARMQGNAPTPQ